MPPPLTSLRLVPGFFVHDADPPPAPFPPHMGLVEGKTWQDVNELVRNSQVHGPKVKLVVLLRHGEGSHNADKARVGNKAWDDEYQFRPEYIDAPMTELGVQQAQSAAKVLEEEVAHGGLLIERVIVSPLDRTLLTYEHAFANLPQFPVTAIEAARETLGVCPCDQRNAMRTKVDKYPRVDFSAIADEEDVLWTPDHRESDTEIEQRALSFLTELYEHHAENHFVVVSHSGFTRGCLRALGRRHFRPHNAEFIPLLLTSEPADASAQN